MEETGKTDGLWRLKQSIGNGGRVSQTKIVGRLTSLTSFASFESQEMMKERMKRKKMKRENEEEEDGRRK